MGFFSWLTGGGLCGMIAKNAAEQYQKWESLRPDLPKEDIPKAIFFLRYGGKVELTPKGLSRLEAYLEYGFECHCLLDFCLASLDIEGNVDPADGKAFTWAAGKIAKGLDGRGLAPRAGEEDVFFDQWCQKIGRKIGRMPRPGVTLERLFDRVDKMG